MGEFLSMDNTYKAALTEGTTRLVREQGYLIVGQGARDGGHGMASTISPDIHENCIELPVFEESQTGIALGMSLAGRNVMSIYPRFDFFISGLSQLINHSDKVREMSAGKFAPNLIFRVGVGAKVPLDAGPQHTNNYTNQMREMLTDIQVHELTKGSNPRQTFDEIINSGGIHLMIEHYEYYGDSACGS